MTIIRTKAFAPKIDPQTGAVTVPSKTTVSLPAGATFVSAEPSSSGGINLWHLVDGLPTEETKTEKRGYIAVRTGVELPEAIADCTFLRTFNGIHIFEIPSHMAKQFANLKTGLEQ